MLDGKTLPGGAEFQKKSASRTVKPIAFYLPQYHPIPENDAWWGPGFTEWTNVTRARQLFRYHDQPRRPERLGYYDLRCPETQEAQAELATEYGVHGFCYYYYWFGGKKLLNRPIEQMLASGRPNFPFCICWANENWSRNWDGQNRHVLLGQDYSTESNLAFIREVIPMMRDPRYIRHNGKPVLIVYRITNIPNWNSVADMWRQECRKAGIGDIHLCAVRFGLEALEGQPESHNLDSYVLFPPHESFRKDIRDEVIDLHPEFGGELFSYQAVVDGDLARFEEGYPWPVHRGAMMAWDNTARRHFAARIFHGANPMRFRAWLEGILRQEDSHNPDSESLVFLNAWNEWAEGTVLEPDERFGTGFLEAVQSALAPYETVTLPQRTARPNTTTGTHPATDDNTAAVREIEKLADIRAYDKNQDPEWFPGDIEFKPGSPTILLVAHISGHQLYGGERSFLDIVEALRTLSYNVIVTLPSSNNPDYVKAIRERTMGLYAFWYPQWRDDRALIERVTLCFERIIHDHGISAVYANTIVLLEPLEAARRSGRKRIVHARELISLDEGLCEQIGLSPARIIPHVFDASDFVIGNSQVTTSTFWRPGKTFCVPNTVSMEAFAKLDNTPGEKIRFGIVSSNLPKKGIGDFIEVVKAIGEDVENIEFVMIGPERDQTIEWREDVKAGRLPSTLRIAGYTETPQEAMDQLDVLLTLSQFAESFGRTVVEAAAAGKPAIGYHWGAIPEVIIDGETGFIAPYRNIEEVAGFVRRFCENPHLVKQMGDRAREAAAERYAFDVFRRNLDQAMTLAVGEAVDGADMPKPVDPASPPPPPAIIIPVYNAFEAFEDCIQSLRRNTPADRLHVIVVDDGSEDMRLSALFAELEPDPCFTVIRNEENQGYTKSINIGIAQAGERDVILLNSDAAVSPNWLDGMLLPLARDPAIGTVTAMSDNAGAFSFPEEGRLNPAPAWLDRDEFGRIMIQATGACEPVDVPTGSGFCMAIRAEMIREIGIFDEQAFPRGYGEENDFCMRALAAGWRNVITPWAYVFHVRSASFGAAKEALVKKGVEEVIRRHPEYTTLVKAAFSSEPMQQLRDAGRACYR